MAYIRCVFVGFDRCLHSTRVAWAIICRFGRASVVCYVDRVALSHEGAWTFVISLWYLGSFLWYCRYRWSFFSISSRICFKCNFQILRWTRTKPGGWYTRRPAGKLLDRWAFSSFDTSIDTPGFNLHQSVRVRFYLQWRNCSLHFSLLDVYLIMVFRFDLLFRGAVRRIPR